VTAVLAAAVIVPTAIARGTATPVVKVTAGKPSELAFKLSSKAVPKGKVIFKVTNAGKSEHDFKIGGKKTPLLRPGKSATLTVTLKTGKAPFLCTVPGHALAGMKGTLTVK
jgi:nitrite reductase (NO-forming)